MIPPEIELLSKRIATAEGIISFPPMSFPIKNIDDILIICLDDLSQGLLLELKKKSP